MRLKRCPKCNDLAELYRIYPSGNHYVKCRFCSLSTEVYKNKDDAIKAWNEQKSLSKYN